MTNADDTIAAIATPPGRGGVGIVRLSGPDVRSIAQGILGRLPRPREALHAAFRDAAGDAIDTGIALYFRAPASFTGEDTLELQGHGGPVVMDMLLQRALSLGARLADPGEFTRRAFLNDKIDLAQAEAVADLIDSASREAARSAARSLQGAFSARVHDLVERLVQLRMYVEAAIDFPEEEIDFLSDGRVAEELEGLIAEVVDVQGRARQGVLLREGMTVVIAGRPNAGKSSLMNALARRDAAIVTDIPGTTRDVLREYITLDGLPLHIVDTAGLRDDPGPVESQGIERAWRAIGQADRILLVVDARTGMDDRVRAIVARLPPGVPVTRVLNKVDLTGRAPGLEDGTPPVTAVSAKTGAGLGALCRHLKETMGYEGGEGGFVARRRHLSALEQAAAALARGREQLLAHGAGELLANDLGDAQQALGEITGAVTSDDLLGRIFSAFCIGK